MNDVVFNFYRLVCGPELSPVCAIVGGVLGQEIITVSSRVYHFSRFSVVLYHLMYSIYAIRLYVTACLLSATTETN